MYHTEEKENNEKYRKNNLFKKISRLVVFCDVD
jgi:hypothetical protein